MIDKKIKIPSGGDLYGLLNAFRKTAENVREMGELHVENVQEDYERIEALVKRKEEIFIILEDEMDYCKKEIEKFKEQYDREDDENSKMEIGNLISLWTRNYEILRSYYAMLLSVFEAFEEMYQNYSVILSRFNYGGKAQRISEEIDATTDKLLAFTEQVENMQWGFLDV